MRRCDDAAYMRFGEAAEAADRRDATENARAMANRSPVELMRDDIDADPLSRQDVASAVLDQIFNGDDDFALVDACMAGDDAKTLAIVKAAFNKVARDRWEQR
jgi:hypothetical protein